MGADRNNQPANIPARCADFGLRIAAGRWAAAGHPDRYPEWHAELAELSAADAGGWAGLRFAASLAVARVPRMAGVGVRERLAGLGAPLLLTLTLLVLPALAEMVLGLQLDYLGTLLSAVPPAAICGEVALLAFGLLLVAGAGRALGRRLPIRRGPVGPYRTLATVAGSVLPLAVGAGLTVTVYADPSGPLGTPLIGIAAWTILMVPLVALVCRRPAVSAHHPVARGRLIGAVGGCLVTAAAVSAAGLTVLSQLPGGARSLPAWLPALLLDDGQFLFGQRMGWLPPLASAVDPIPMLLLAATALGLSYATTALRDHPARRAPVPAATAPAGRDPLPSRVFALGAVAAGGGLWLFLAGWGTRMVRPFAEWLVWHHDADDFPIIVGGTFELRKLALAVCCGGLALALRRRGPAWPLIAALPALWAVDLALAHLQPSGPVTLTVGLLAGGALLGAAAVTQSRTATPRRPYGQRTAMVVGAAAAYCVPAVVTIFGAALPAGRSTLTVGLPITFGALLGALAGYCVGAAEGRRSTVRRVLSVLAGSAGAAALGVVAGNTDLPGQLLGLLGPMLALLVVLLVFPRPRRRWWWLLAAVLPAGPMLAMAALVLSTMIDMIAPPDGVNYGDGPPLMPGSILLGVLLALGLRAWLRRPPTARRMRMPHPAEPLPAAGAVPRSGFVPLDGSGPGDEPVRGATPPGTGPAASATTTTEAGAPASR